MTEIRKHSAGGVVFSGGRVLTINWQTKASIEFPKGGVDSGESTEAAALREVAEETGYLAGVIAPLGNITYQYHEHGQQVVKTVDYFLMDIPATNDRTPLPHREPGENFTDLWLSIKQANLRLTHDDSRIILQRAVDIMNLLGDDGRRSVRYVDQTVKRLGERPDFVPVVIGCMLNSHRGLAMRAADAAEKFSRRHVESLQPYVEDLVKIAITQTQREVRWHLAQLLPRLKLSYEQAKSLLDIWNNDFYNSPSRLVRVASLQAVHDIAKNYPSARKKFEQMLDFALERGGASVKARARQLR